MSLWSGMGTRRWNWFGILKRIFHVSTKLHWILAFYRNASCSISSQSSSISSSADVNSKTRKLVAVLGGFVIVWNQAENYSSSKIQISSLRLKVGFVSTWLQTHSFHYSDLDQTILYSTHWTEIQQFETKIWNTNGIKFGPRQDNIQLLASSPDRSWKNGFSKGSPLLSATKICWQSECQMFFWDALPWSSWIRSFIIEWGQRQIKMSTQKCLLHLHLLLWLW